mmetsp:Transcript_13895/g.15681  ORF Transcript_13895/g.15681 Transcript_13895/m.15681 type:complete len:200 (+) Transcript_13895:57-656(+)
MKSHYETLNVPPTATKDDIKKSFHKLSLKYHPDLTKSKSTTNNELFKQISSAYSILSDDVQKQKYDLDLEEWKKFGVHRRRRGVNGFDSSATGGNRRGMGYAAKFHVLDGIYKPRNMIIGITLGLVAVSTVKSVLGIEDDVKPSEKAKIVGDGTAKLVEAWKNPNTGHWEQPAPWSKSFQRLNPEIHLVPRENVRPSSR